jgi:hypothetical protein
MSSARRLARKYIFLPPMMTQKRNEKQVSSATSHLSYRVLGSRQSHYSGRAVPVW